MDKTVLHKISYGLYVIGVPDGNRVSGCIVNTVFQITSAGVIAISMNHNNYTHSLIEKEGRLAVSILSEQTPGSVIGALGFASGRDKDKFAGIAYELHDGLPIVKENACGYLICDIVGKHETETHTVFFAEVKDAFAGEKLPPMTYEYYHRVIKGSAPKNAPTYQEPEKKEIVKEESSVKYECSVCHYVYEGDINLEPDDYVCPICGVGKEMFEKIEG